MQETVLQNAALTVTVAALGAQMLSVRDAQGRQRLWGGDAAVWGYRAPILFPVAGRFTQDRYLYKDGIYCMKRHGFARESEFALIEHARTRAVYMLDKPQENYPFNYAFYAAYELQDNRLCVTYTVRNNGRDTMYFGLGSHEAYALRGDVSRYALRFDKAERLEAHELTPDSQVGDKTRLFAEQGDTLPLKEEYFDCDTLVFMDLRSRGVRLVGQDEACSVHVSYPGMDYLLIWKKKGAPFLCIEPWCNPPDPVGWDGRLEHKPGMAALKPGEETERTHVISFD